MNKTKKYINLSLSVLVAAFGAVVMLSISAPKAYAADICWDGGGSTNNWSEDANWAGDTEPGTGDVAVFDNGTCSGTPNKSATIDGAISVQGINLVSYSGTVDISSSNSLVLGTSGFTQGSGTFDIGTGVVLSLGDFTRTGGTFDGGTGAGTYAHFMQSNTLSGSTTFNNLAFVAYTGQQVDNIASGTVLTVEGELSLDGSNDPNDALDGPGEIHAQGDVGVVDEGFQGGGDVVIRINGTGTQTLTGEADSDTLIPSLTIDKPSGTLNLVDEIVIYDDYIYEQGTISPGTSTISKHASRGIVDGSHTLANFRFITSSGDGQVEVTSGTILTLTGDLTIDGSSDPNDSLHGPGEVHVQGDIEVIADGVDGGDLNIVATGTGTQNLIGDTTTGISSFEIDKPSGTLNISNTIFVDQNWVYTQGTVSAGASHIIIRVGTGVVTGTHTLNDVSFITRNGSSVKEVTSGTVLTVAGDLIIDGTSDNNDTLNGPGAIVVQGNLTVVTDGIQGDVPISFTGTANQSITTAGSNLTDGTFTINKSSGTVTLTTALNLNGSGQDLIISSGTLAMSTFALTVNDVLTINGDLTQGSGNVTAASFVVGSSGVWANFSTGDIIVGSGGVANAGEINFGDLNSCGGADSISITSSSGGAQRDWTGVGEFNFYDLSIQDQGGSASITAYSSTSVSGNDTNWTINANCPQATRIQDKVALGNPASATFDATPTEGNLLRATTFHRSGASGSSISGSGWELVFEEEVSLGDSTYRRAMAVYEKIAGASEPTNIETNWTGGVTNRLLIEEFEPLPGMTWNERETFVVSNSGNTPDVENFSTGTTGSVDAQNLMAWAVIGQKAGGTGGLGVSVAWTNGFGDNAGSEAEDVNGLALWSGYKNDNSGGTFESQADIEESLNNGLIAGIIVWSMSSGEEPEPDSSIFQGGVTIQGGVLIQ